MHQTRRVNPCGRDYPKISCSTLSTSSTLNQLNRLGRVLNRSINSSNSSLRTFKLSKFSSKKVMGSKYLRRDSMGRFNCNSLKHPQRREKKETPESSQCISVGPEFI